MAMSWETVFGIANLFALVAWLALILLPRGETLYTILREGAVGVLCLLYAICLILILFVLPAAGGDGTDFSTIAGVQSIFATEAGTTVGWVHYLAFDLFVGLWVARRSDEIALSRIVQAPILLATYLFGPFGLLIFLIIRRIHTARTAT